MNSNMSPQKRENARTVECTTPRTAAPYRSPVILLALTTCLNRQPSPQGPAKNICSLTQNLTNLCPRYNCPQMRNTSQKPLTRGDMATRCGLETEMGRVRRLHLQWADCTRLPHTRHIQPGRKSKWKHTTRGSVTAESA